MNAPSMQHDEPELDGRWMFDHAVSLTRMMVSAARAGDWERVSQLDEQRRLILLEGSVVESIAWPGEHITEVLDLNEQVLRMVVQARGEYERQLGDLARGKHGTAAYQRLDY
jgi:hypothetical protein